MAKICSDMGKMERLCRPITKSYSWTKGGRVLYVSYRKAKSRLMDAFDWIDKCFGHSFLSRSLYHSSK